jgi:hypothetical protein
MSMSFVRGDRGYFGYFRDQAQEEVGLALGENPQGRGYVLDYLSEKHTLAGQWIGAHAAAMGLSGEADQLSASILFELAQHPVTRQQLGKQMAEYQTLDERVAGLMAKLAEEGELAGLTPAQVDERRAATRQELQRTMQDRVAVTCIDYTAATTKSVSALYGMLLAAGDEQGAATVRDAANRAFDRAVVLFEADFLKSRLGVPGTSVVAQVDVTSGAIGVGYLHETARPAMGLEAMPHLHKHMLFSTRVQVFDPKSNSLKWLQMDTALARGARQVLSAYVDLAVEQEITAALGVQFVTPDHELAKPVGERNREIRGLDAEEFLRAWSARAAQIEPAVKREIEAFVSRTGRQPTQAEEIRIGQAMNKQTREAKKPDRAGELVQWASIAKQHLGADWRDRISALATGPAAQLDPAAITFAQRRDLAAQAVAELEAEGRVAWTGMHIQARVVRILTGTYGAQLSAQDADGLIAELTQLAAEHSIACTGYQALEGELAAGISRRRDGTSIFVRHGEKLFTTASILRKEADVVAWSRDVVASRRISLRSFEAAAQYWAQKDGHGMAPDQDRAARHLCTSGRSLDSMVGPPGSGKTTTLKVVARAAQLDGRKVIGLTLAQGAAEVLNEGAKLDEVYNMADFRTRIEHGHLTWQKGALYLVDEASAVTLPDLHTLTESARAHGASVILTGDYRQHGTVAGAGGTLRQVHEENPGAELTSVWRFTTTDAAGKKVLDTAYADLTLRVRSGDPAAAKEMVARGMVKFGTAEAMHAAAVADWEANLRRGIHAVIPVRSNEDRAAMARRGVQAMLEGGHLGADTGWVLRDGTPVHVGAFVVARQTTGEVRFAPDNRNGGRGAKVANRHAFKVVGYNPLNGDLMAKSQSNGKTLTLPRSYWAEHVESSIAATGLGVQGLTVGADHTLLTAASTNADLLVGMTRGTTGHTVYVVTDEVDASGETSSQFRSPEEALAAIIRRDASERSATQRIDDDWADEHNLVTLTGRHRYYADLARLAARKDAEKVLRDAMGRAAESVMTAEAWPALADLVVELRAGKVDVVAEIMDTLAERGLGDAVDPASILHHRLGGQGRLRDSRQQGQEPDAASVVVPWLVSPELFADAGDSVLAMRAYELAAVQRATYLADHALREQLTWVAQLGAPPADAARRAQYLATVSAVAAFRENYAVGSGHATLLGDDRAAGTREQAVQAQVAHLVSLYRDEVAAVSVEDLVLTVVGTREASFPAMAFQPGSAAGHLGEFPVAQAEPAPWWERTWGAVSDAGLRAQAAALSAQVPPLEVSISRLQADVKAKTDRVRAEQQTVNAGGGMAVRALGEQRDRLARQEALQAQVVQERDRRAAARASADAAATRIAKLEAAASSRFARGRTEAAAELLATRREHHALLADMRKLDARVDALQKAAGPDVAWAKVRQERDELGARWEQMLEIATGTDLAVVKQLRADVKRVAGVLEQSRGRLVETRSKVAQLRAEAAYRKAQDELFRAADDRGRADAQRLLVAEHAAGLRQVHPTEGTLGADRYGRGVGDSGCEAGRTAGVV